MFKIYGDGFLLFTCETLAEAVECWGQTRGLYKYRRDFVFQGVCYIAPITEEELKELV